MHSTRIFVTNNRKDAKLRTLFISKDQNVNTTDCKHAFNSAKVMAQVNDLSSMYWQQRTACGNYNLILQCDSPFRILLELIDSFHKLIRHSVNFRNIAPLPA